MRRVNELEAQVPAAKIYAYVRLFSHNGKKVFCDGCGMPEAKIQWRGWKMEGQPGAWVFENVPDQGPAGRGGAIKAGRVIRVGGNGGNRAKSNLIKVNQT